MIRILIIIFLFFLLAENAGAQLLITEICPSNKDNLLDEDGDAPDWFELHNNSDSILALSEFYLSDKYDNIKKWKFPDICLNPREYLVLFASGKNRKVQINHWETIIKAEDLWYLYIGNNAPDTNWNKLNYTHSPTSWIKRNGPFGRDYPLIQSNTFTEKTIYISKYFALSDTSLIDYGRFYMDYDDAFVAYLNGVEIARANIGAKYLIAEYDDIAFDVHESKLAQGEIPAEFKISREQLKNILQEGNNVLSIQVHNAWNNHGACLAAPYLFLSFSDTTLHHDTLLPWFPPQNYFMHTNFKLSAADLEGVVLSRADTLFAARFFPILSANHTYACVDDTSGMWQICENPTPGFSNFAAESYSSYASKAIFSHASGFYSAPFTLSLSTYNNADSIFYTLDGSEPDRTAVLFNTPINIDSVTVVRTRVYRADEVLPGPISTASYFVGINKDLPVISLVTDPKNLWDSISGIYVMGTNASPVYPYYGANYWMDWERPAHIEFFDENKEQKIAQDLGIKIHGRISRTFPMKSLRLIARGTYGESSIDYKVFPSKEIHSYKRLILRNSGHDFNKSHFRDAFIQKSIQDKTHSDVQDYLPVVTYINGEYWGIFNLREKIDEDYIEDNYSIPKDNVDMLETYIGVVHGEYDHYYKMMEYVKANNASDSLVFDSIAAMLDFDNFIDYFAVQIFSGNTDWPNNNIKYWRERTVNAKWRYVFFDLDASFSLSSPVTNNDFSRILHANIQWCENHILFRKLMQNIEFRNSFINRAADLMNTILHPQSLNAGLDKFEARLSTEMPMHFQRWGSSVSAWQNQIQVMRSFSNQRAQYFRNHIQSEYSLTAQRQINLDVFPPEGGKIKINTIYPDSFPWSGIYFQDVPISIEAFPAPGYRFASWQSDAAIQEDSVKNILDLMFDTYATAYFEHDICSDTLIVVSEINYTSSNEYNTEDWFEIHNYATESINLAHWCFKDEKDNHLFVFPHDTWIRGNDYLVVCEDTTAFKQLHPQLSNFIGNFNFGLGSTSDQIRIFDSEGKIVFSISYENGMPWPVLESNSSKTIELLDIYADVNNGANWFAGCPGGSPGGPFVPCDTTVIKEHNIFSAFVYPNPFNNITQLCFSSDIDSDFQINVFNALGVLIFEENIPTHAYELKKLSFDFSNHPKGIYYCIIRNQNHQQSFSLIAR